MSWIELDDQILNHPKFVRAAARGGGDAVFMWLGLRAYCAQNLSDGLVPADMLEECKGPRGEARAKALAVLKDVGLVDEGPEGLRLHDYLEWASSKAEVLERRASARQRKSRSRSRHGVTPPVTDAVTDSGVTPPVTPGVPSAVRSESQTPARAPAGEGGGSGSGSGSPEGEQGEDTRVRCPPTLRLTPDEVTALAISPGIQDWQVEAMSGAIVPTLLGGAPRPLSSWRVTLIKAICRTWSDPAQRPKKPEAPDPATLRARAARDRMEAEERARQGGPDVAPVRGQAEAARAVLAGVVAAVGGGA